MSVNFAWMRTGLAVAISLTLCAALALSGTGERRYGPGERPKGAKFYDAPYKLPKGHGDLIGSARPRA